MQTSRLGEILVNNNLITREQLAAALREQKMSGGRTSLAPSWSNRVSSASRI